MIIREMPESERPREKLRMNGAKSLTNAELLAVLLASGTKEKTAMDLAEEILSMSPEGIVYLTECAFEELAGISGMGLAKTSQLLAAVELGSRIATTPRRKRDRVSSPEDIANIFMEKMRYYRKEYFNVVLFNAKGDIIAEENITVGDLSSSIVHPRESFSSAVRRGAAAVAFVHNHPSGDPSPSEEDVLVTKRLAQAGSILGIRVLDHVIIGDGRYSSLREKGLIE